MRFLYTAGIFFYTLVIRLSAIAGNNKAQLWVRGRKNLLQNFLNVVAEKNLTNCIWFHVSSLGEFEQGRPLIDAIKNQHPNIPLVLTFFSPSGFEMRKNYPNADAVFYLPADLLSTMKKLVSILQPKIVFFVKYDFWYNLLAVLHQRQIPVFFISSVFRTNQYFFKWYGLWFRNQLRKVNTFFVQTQESLSILNKYSISNAVFAGDTRLDRVLTLKSEHKELSHIEQLTTNKHVLIAGSTWPADEILLKRWHVSHPHDLIIIAPHDISETRIKSIESSFGSNATRLSQFNSTTKTDVLIIDSIGLLAYLYRFAHMVYIGNGFGKGIHNILEPIVWGKPVVFGPNYRKFPEAISLINSGGAFTICTYEQMESVFTMLLSQSEVYQYAAEQCLNYTETHSGATAKILNYSEAILRN